MGWTILSTLELVNISISVESDIDINCLCRICQSRGFLQYASSLTYCWGNCNHGSEHTGSMPLVLNFLIAELVKADKLKYVNMISKERLRFYFHFSDFLIESELRNFVLCRLDSFRAFSVLHFILAYSRILQIRRFVQYAILALSGS